MGLALEINLSEHLRLLYRQLFNRLAYSCLGAAGLKLLFWLLFGLGLKPDIIGIDIGFMPGTAT